MTKRLKIIFIRHGLIDSNTAGVYCGCRTDEGLCEEGIRGVKEKRNDIRKLVGRISSDGSVRYFSGPMKRVRQTAGLLFEDVPMNVIRQFTEIDFGDFEGKSAKELTKSDPRYQEWIDSGGELPFPNGESHEELIARTLAGLWDVIRQSEDGETAVIVCHGGTVMAAMSAISDTGFYEADVENLGGYAIKITTDDERILDITYERIGGGSDT